MTKPKIEESILESFKEDIQTMRTHLDNYDSTEYTQLAAQNMEALIFWLDKAIDDVTNGRDDLAGQLAVAIYDEDEDRIAEIAKMAFDRGIEFEDICTPGTEEYMKAVKVVSECSWFKEKDIIH